MHPSAAHTRARLLRPATTLGALSLAAVGLTALPASAVVNEDGSVTVDVLGITDFHGALEQAPYLAGQIDAITAENPDTLFVSAGDNIGGSTYESAIQQDVPTIDVLNAMGLDASAVGNHEFDAGYADLRDRVLPLADWDYLGANVGGAPELAPYTVVDVSGVSVAFVGSVTEETPTIVSKDGIAGLTFGDPVAATNEVAATLSDGDPDNGEADVVVALIHEGVHVVDGFTGDIDAVFTGHTHVDLVGSTTPSGAPVVQAGAAGSHLGRITLTVTTGGDVTGTGSLIPIDGTGPADAEVQAIVDEALAQADVLGQNVVGEASAPINGGSNDGTTAGSEPPVNRGTESPLGNFLAGVAKWTAEQVDLAPDFGIINPGGIRADLDADGNGEVTYAEAFTTQPFGNTIGTVDLTGAQVVTLLEQQWNTEQTVSRPMLRLGLSDDVEYVYDPAGAAGERITEVYIDGAPIVLTDTYRVASNTFLLDGLDGFTVLGEGANLKETGIVDLQGLIDYLDTFGSVSPDYSQRSVGVTGPQELESGTEVTLELSSLAFTTTEPNPTEVTVSLAGKILASAPVDATITPARDETGRATVTFTVPALEEGAYDLVISTDYTEIALPVQVVELPPGLAATHPGKGNVPQHVLDMWAAKTSGPRG
ncbi:bifunctional metallophosphatase/5'-nucleotidase [Georgenia muralis]|uniref:5'-nucleotidase n=1 Tax=Georgenia muralis TaxID=154117 RepID=A0A3N4ZNI0_9MICO|nr:5'-nucleotidase C-terminal domain-containing protein [Georgenia muralis]RPF27252.1 5'-nucleotidase [Georgenia muralis]